MKRFLTKLSLSLAVAATTFLVGCAGPAPSYSPSIDNVESLKNARVAPANVGTFSTKPAMTGAESLGLRASTMVSPVGKNYGDYLSAALRSELELAKLYDPASPTTISGTLLSNNINAGGMSTNDGQIEARFVVSRGAEVRFDKVKKIEHVWEGAFAGAVAIPLAANNYTVMVQKLIKSLVGDPDFSAALKN